jgi:hypothetical protein
MKNNKRKKELTPGVGIEISCCLHYNFITVELVQVIANEVKR